MLSLLPGFSAHPLSVPPSSPLSHQRPRWEAGEAVLTWYLLEDQRAQGGGRGGKTLMRRHVALLRADSGSGKQRVYLLSGDDGFYFMAKCIVVESMMQRQRNPDKSPGVCQH